MILQAFQYRLRETPTQAALMRRFAGCRRFVWNKALEEQQARYARGESYAGFAAMCRWVTAWRAESGAAFLKETPVHALQESVRSLDAAFKRFFAKKGGYPKFKRKAADEGWRETDVKCFAVSAGTSRVRLPKLGWIRFRQSRPLLGKPCSVSLRQSARGWFVSIQTEREGLVPCTATASVGIDRGVTFTLAESNGRLTPAANLQREKLVRLARYQRSCARKRAAAKRAAGLKPHQPWPAGKRPKDSNRLRLAQAKVSRLHAQIRNARTDWLHKESTRIVSENALVVLEDLNIRAMSTSAAGTKERPGKRVRQKAGLNRSILDQGWGEFSRQLAYKLQWRGGLLVKIPPAYTSQRCAHCGHVAAENRHRLRFACVACGHKDHADVNAAKNILAAGHAVLAGVSPGHADVEAAAVSAACEASTTSQMLV